MDSELSSLVFHVINTDTVCLYTYSCFVRLEQWIGQMDRLIPNLIWAMSTRYLDLVRIYTFGKDRCGKCNPPIDTTVDGSAFEGHLQPQVKRLQAMFIMKFSQRIRFYFLQSFFLALVIPLSGRARRELASIYSL